jgi:inner membrane protein
LATPIGHSILGICILRIAGKNPSANVWLWYGFAIFAANAPDFDFLPGLIVGDINLFHQGPSHSIVAALIFGLLSMLLSPLFKVSKLTMMTVGSLSYASHLLLDYFVLDRRPPFGIPLAWPFTDQHWASPVSLFYGIKHGNPGDGMGAFLEHVFSFHNLAAVGKEFVYTMPFLVIAWFIKRPQWQKTSVAD